MSKLHRAALTNVIFGGISTAVAAQEIPPDLAPIVESCLHGTIQEAFVGYAPVAPNFSRIAWVDALSSEITDYSHLEKDEFSSEAFTYHSNNLLDVSLMGVDYNRRWLENYRYLKGENGWYGALLAEPKPAPHMHDYFLADCYLWHEEYQLGDINWIAAWSPFDPLVTDQNPDMLHFWDTHYATTTAASMSGAVRLDVSGVALMPEVLPDAPRTVIRISRDLEVYE